MPIAAFGFLIFSYLGKIPPLNTESSEPFPEAVRQIVWLIFLIIGVTLIGMLPAIGLFVFCYMTIEGRAKPINTIIIIVPFLFGIWFLFHELLHIIFWSRPSSRMSQYIKKEGCPGRD